MRKKTAKTKAKPAPGATRPGSSARWAELEAALEKLPAGLAVPMPTLPQIISLPPPSTYYSASTPLPAQNEPLYDLSMTIEELARKSGLSSGKAEMWVESGLIEPMAGQCREFGDDQIERVRLVQELQRKGVALPQLAGRNLAFSRSERFVVFDDRELRAYADAEAAIGAVVRSRRACSAVDLAAIRG
jgi:hypothetical protein